MRPTRSSGQQGARTYLQVCCMPLATLRRASGAQAGELRVVLKKTLQPEWAVPLHAEASTDAATDVFDSPPEERSKSSPSKQPQPAAMNSSALPSSPRADVTIAAASSAIPISSPPASISPPAASTSAPGMPGTSSARSSARLADTYAAWDRFDDVGALMDVENEGKAKDEPGFTLRSIPASSAGKNGGKATPGVAAMQCTDYVKDREEISLDEDLASSRSSLQQACHPGHGIRIRIGARHAVAICSRCCMHHSDLVCTSPFALLNCADSECPPSGGCRGQGRGKPTAQGGHAPRGTRAVPWCRGRAGSLLVGQSHPLKPTVRGDGSAPS